MKNMNRNSNIEILRVISALAVIILHLNGTSNVVLESINDVNLKIMVLLECLAIPAVNIFILISGSLMINKYKITLWKPLLLLFQVSFIKVVFYFIHCYILDTKTLSITGLLYSILPNNYFVVFYVVVYILSIYINNTLNKQSYKVNREMIVVLLLLLSVYPFAVDLFNDFLFYIKGTTIGNLSTISRMGSLGGYSIVHFLLMYILGCYISINKDNIKRIGVAIPLIIYLICSLLIYITTFWSLDTKAVFQPGIMLSYNNPIIVIQSLAAVVFFYNKKPFQSVLINKISSASFMCYLVHVEIITWFFTKIRINWTNICGFLTYYFSFIILTYMLSILLNQIYSITEKCMFSKLRLQFPFELTVKNTEKEEQL